MSHSKAAAQAESQYANVRSLLRLPIVIQATATCPCIFGPIILGRRLGWGRGDAAA